MALPVWAYYMKKVYADKSLGYSPQASFNLPEGYDACTQSSDDEFEVVNEVDEVFE